MSGRGICPPPLLLRYSAGGLTLLSWFDIDFEYGENQQKVSLNNMASAGQDLLITDPRGI